MSRALKAVVVCIPLGLLAACGGDDNGSGSGSSGAQVAMTVYNEVTDATGLFASAVNVDLFANDSSTALLTKIAYSTKSAGTDATVTMKDGGATFTVAESGNQKTLVQDASVPLSTDSSYTTVIMGGLNGTVNVNGYAQTLDQVPAGSVRIRFIHAMSALSPSSVDLAASDGTAIATVDYQGATDYTTLKPVFGSLKITVNQNGTALDTLSCSVKAGNSYDAILAYTSFKGSALSLFCHQIS